MFSLEALTLGEVAAIEDLSGAPIDTMGDAPKGKMFAAIAYVMKRRTDPDFKFKDALELTFEQAQEIMGVTEDDPKD